MNSEARQLEDMTCDELLAELSRLTSERDHTQSQVGTPQQAVPEQSTQVEGMMRQSNRMDRIGELLKSKGCQ
jgi:hypothetical protein